MHQLRTLFWLVVANITASIIHYTDNLLFLEAYPEPDWIEPHLIDGFWFFMTPFAILGYRAMRKEAVGMGCLLLCAYGLMSLLVLGHYLYAPFLDIPPKIHLFIFLEAAMALLLLSYVLLFVLSRKGGGISIQLGRP